MTYKKMMTKDEKRQYAINKRTELVNGMAQQILDLIENKQGDPYKKAWSNSAVYGLPYNPVTGHRYTGFNLISLLMSARPDPRFMTYEQIALMQKDTQGIHLKKGSKGVTVLRPVVIKGGGEQIISEAGESASVAESESDRQRVFFKQYTVFSGDQVEGLPALTPPAERTWKDDPLVENLVRLSGMRVIHGGNRAYYNPGDDETHLPHKNQFDSLEAYTSVQLHEWYHWTGHGDRDNRHLSGDAHSESYAIEELRAETFSALAGRLLGLPYDLGHHASYIQSWNAVLKSDPENVIKAAVQAGKMLEVVIDFSNQMQPDPPWFPVIKPEDFTFSVEEEDDYGPLFI